jgi:hypothetical protein
MLHHSNTHTSEDEAKPNAAGESRVPSTPVALAPLGPVGAVEKRACPVCLADVPIERGPCAVYCSPVCRGRNKKGNRGWLSDGRRLDCERCGDPIETGRLRNQAGRTRYCATCGPEAHRERCAKKKLEYRARGVRFRSADRVASPFAGLMAGDVGALSELLASADLIRRGFHVFRAVSPSAPCDLIAVSEQGTFRVEVKTAGRKANGGIVRPKISARVRTRFDVVAYVVHDGAIVYSPEWPKAS